MKLALFYVVAAIYPWMSLANPTPNDPDTFNDILKKSSHGTLLPNSQIPVVEPFPTNALDSYFSFKPTLKNTSNPVHDRMPVRVRLTGRVSWLSKDRSDDKQCLTVKFLIGWCEALLSDLQTFGGGYSNNPTELLRMRAQHPIILFSLVN